jgi:hypothetical protein
VKTWRIARQCFFDRIDDRQGVVGDVDRVRRRLGGRLIFSCYSGDRLASEPYAVNGHDWTVPYGVTKVRIDVDKILPGENRDHTRYFQCTPRIDRCDLRVSNRAAQYASMKHPRDLDVARIFGFAAGFFPGIDPGQPGADLRYSLSRHAQVSAL